MNIPQTIRCLVTTKRIPIPYSLTCSFALCSKCLSRNLAVICNVIVVYLEYNSLHCYHWPPEFRWRDMASRNLANTGPASQQAIHDHVIKWYPRYWPFVRGIHQSPVNSPHNGQWRGAWMFPLICAWINGWVNNREAGDLRRHRAHYDVTLMYWEKGGLIVTNVHVT